MYSLLPLIFLLVPIALAFPKHGPKSEGPKSESFHHHHSDITTIYPTLTVSSLPSTDIFPTVTGTGTIFSYPTAFPTGDFKKRRDLAVLQGRKWKGSVSGSSGCAKATGRGKHGDGDDDDDDNDN